MSTLGERLVEGLAARGVEVVFGIPGVHTIELYRGLASGQIRHVTPRHEQGAGFMADGYARVTGKPGVAFVITGPGILNTLTAMGQAKADSIPMLVISGVNRRSSLGKGLGLLHELPDQAAMVRPLCHSERIEDPADLGPALDRAFAAMFGPRPGPAHIEIPTDVMGLPCPALPAPVAPPAAPQASPEALQQAARLLNAAQNPVILAGGGTRRAEAALRALAEALDAPVIQTVNARGAMHGHALTVAASPSLAATRALIAQSDAILALGTELGPTDYDMYVNGQLPDLSAMIRVDLCAQQLARHKAQLPIQADAAGFMASLLPLLTQKQAQGATRAATASAAARKELGDLHPEMPGQLTMVEAIRDALPGTLIVGDSTQPVYAANLCYDHDRPGGWFNAATGFGALGYGPGAAIGAAVASGAHVTCLIGDGGLGFDPAELRVAVDESLPITFLVWNNAAYREIAEAMIGAQTKVIGCDPSPFDMKHFAAACSLPYQQVAQDPQELKKALRQPVNGPRLIEVTVKIDR
ncbi:5-guanidino-2-oxopentanoate decarboxylase [Xinfangfangia sp. CPCC 101601]|uniref:5-guanidino-2-oxopentanoate decarboxylase n=1 Tax=Pseudogemmobacter lacusdianii TaxID=3069608 RepID=A0ABU0VWK8_9RHOB|nr:5-guanidino-2-oxopentanoate decarboxylase [Xinfangfangia sp. CPCC 101601]MDQ2066104.1 5-guanidino-2-oxopentanoate decarboxylase [Xinfangfangia sp. CPCC 101601]